VWSCSLIATPPDTPLRLRRGFLGVNTMKNSKHAVLPDDAAVADARLYARLQREAQAREDAAQTVSLASLIVAPRDR